MDPRPDPNSIIPPPDEEGCHAIYAQDYLPTFELEFEPDVWESLRDQWLNGAANKELYDEGLLDEYRTYHPVAKFRYRDIVITDAAARLRGNPRYWVDQGKLQLQISFHHYVKGKRFLGLRKVLFDAASANRSFMRDRLALATMRDLGMAAPCANHARLYVNGEYYGLFTSIEKLDKRFLVRTMPDPEGDLWKRASWQLKTNEETASNVRIRALRNAETLQEMEQYLDMDEALLLWAVDAVIPNSDGAWAGGLNFYLYDDPVRNKFVLLPWDLDNTYTRLPTSTDLVTWHKEERFRGRPWYDMALADPDYFAAYIDKIEHVLEHGYVVPRMQERVDVWTEQIKEAAFEDLNKPFSNLVYLQQVEAIRQYLADRASFTEEWLSCWRSGGQNDGEGRCIPPN